MVFTGPNRRTKFVYVTYFELTFMLCNICTFYSSIGSSNNHEYNKGGCAWSNKVPYFVTPLIVAEGIK